ncbi:unnamed protein product, partial [Effrenium voratum]
VAQFKRYMAALAMRGSVEELLVGQVIPVYDHLWQAAGFTACPINFERAQVSVSAIRRMAGNSFNQCCACAFTSFIMANLEPSAFQRI